MPPGSPVLCTRHERAGERATSGAVDTSAAGEGGRRKRGNDRVAIRFRTGDPVEDPLVHRVVVHIQ